MIHRQRISVRTEIDGSPWLVTVTRDFAKSATLSQCMSSDQFFRFVADEQGAIRSLARRKIAQLGLADGKVMWTKQICPEPEAASIVQSLPVGISPAFGESVDRPDP